MQTTNHARICQLDGLNGIAFPETAMQRQEHLLVFTKAFSLHVLAGKIKLFKAIRLTGNYTNNIWQTSTDIQEKK
jgi:hypothetical protein